MKPPIPLRYYLSLHFSMAAILPALTIAGLVYFFMVPDIRERTKIQHQAMADSISGQVSAYLGGGERQINALAEHLENLGIQPGGELTGLLDAQCGDGEFFETLFVLNKADTGIQAVGLPELRRPTREDLIGLDLSSRAFIKEVEETKHTFLSKTFLSMVSNRLAVALAAPLPDGFIIGEITLDKLSDFIREQPAKSGFVTMVIDGEGIVVADSMKRRWGQILDINFSAAGEPDQEKDSAIQAFELDGTKMLGALVKMDRIGWRVLVAQPAGKVFEPLGKIFSLLAWGMAVAIGMVLALSWLLAGRFTDLFTSYSKVAESIARGDYDLRWPHVKTRESFRMGESLQRMAEKIRQREKDLVESEWLLKNLTANVPGVVIQFRSTRDHAYTNEFLSAKCLDIFGLEPDSETILDQFYAHIPDAEKAAYIASIRGAIDTVSPWIYEGRFNRPDGQTIWFSGHAIPHDAGETLVYYGVLLDVTERKRIEESLRIARFSFDNANVGIHRVTRDGRIKEVNRQFAQSLGYTKKELEMMSIMDIDTSITGEDWESIWKQLVDRGLIAYEREHRRKDGRLIPVEIYANFLEYEGQQYAISFAREIAERKRMEQALKESEERLELALAGANEGIWDWHIDRGKIYFDDRYYTMAGYTPHEFPGAFDEWANRVHREDLVQAKEAVAKHLAGESDSFEVEFRFQRKDGSYMWVESKGKIVARNDRGEPVRFIGTHADITGRKHAEAALRENEQLLANILESMNEGVFVLDREFRNTVYNKGMETITNVCREDVIGKRPWEAFPYITNTPVEENIRKAMAGKAVAKVQMPHPDNPNTWSRDSFSPLRDADGRVIGVVGVLTDITRQKRDEEEMRRLRNYLSNIIDSMPSILVAADREGRVTQWNRKAAQVTGLSSDDARSRPLEEVFPGLANEMERIRMSIRDRRVIKTPKKFRMAAQQARYEDITIFPLVANGVEGAVIRVDDVTQQVRLEEMMIQSEKMLSVGGLAAGMAHEINNPLAGILQNASVLSNRLTGDLPANHKAAEAAGTTMEAIRDYLELRKLTGMIDNIRESGSRAATIVKNMLSFSRKSDKVVSSHDLGELLDQTLELVRTDYDMKKSYDFKQIEVVREYDDTADLVPCEASKIQQVFMNILKNGAEAMAGMQAAPRSPAFTLRVRDDGDWIRVEIEDNGPGMDEATRRRIFEPFFTTKPVGKGTGLGLSVSYFIITEDHGGEMGVQAAEGGGTRFVVRLPKGGISH